MWVAATWQFAWLEKLAQAPPGVVCVCACVCVCVCVCVCACARACGAVKSNVHPRISVNKMAMGRNKGVGCTNIQTVGSAITTQGEWCDSRTVADEKYILSLVVVVRSSSAARRRECFFVVGRTNALVPEWSGSDGYLQGRFRDELKINERGKTCVCQRVCYFGERLCVEILDARCIHDASIRKRRIACCIYLHL
jgi:hypothetical protein